MTHRLFAVLTLSVALAAGASGQSTTGEPAERPAEQEADRKGAVAGEAPPAEVQSERSPAGEEGSADERESPARPRPGRVKPRPGDAAEHLSRIEAIVEQALSARPAEPPEDETAAGTAGTTGTPVTEPTGEMLTIERAKLEEIRLHLAQLRTAMGLPERPCCQP